MYVSQICGNRMRTHSKTHIRQEAGFGSRCRAVAVFCGIKHGLIYLCPCLVVTSLANLKNYRIAQASYGAITKDAALEVADCLALRAAGGAFNVDELGEWGKENRLAFAAAQNWISVDLDFLCKE